MAKTFAIPAELRDDQGKGASRRLRRQGLVPAIIYGAGRDPRSLQIPHHFLLKALEDESFFTSLLEIDASGRKQKVVLRDLQRHPYRQQIMHADFQRISDDEKLRMNIPLHFVNETDSPAGKMAGVVISHNINDVEILCLPKDLPEYLEVDLAEMDVGTIVHLSDISLPGGVEITALAHEDDAVVATAAHVAVTTTSDEVEGEGEEDAPEAEGEASDEAPADDGGE